MIQILSTILSIGKDWGPWGIIFGFIVTYITHRISDKKQSKKNEELRQVEKENNRKYIENMLDLIKMIIRDTFKLGQKMKSIEDKVLVNQRKELDECGDDIQHKFLSRYEKEILPSLDLTNDQKDDFVRIYRMIVFLGVSKGKKEMYEFIDSTLSDYSSAEYELQKQDKLQKILDLVEEVERENYPSFFPRSDVNNDHLLFIERNKTYLKDRIDKSFDTLKIFSDKSKKEANELLEELDKFEEKAKQIFLRTNIDNS